jgi:8-amino-7-oxononanoate synthase
MPDFTSALYLGMRHPNTSLRPWREITTGMPAALRSPPIMQSVANAIAELQGCEHAVLLPSTLHLFFDLFEMFRRERARVYLDAGAYPIARWGAERAAARGLALHVFPHYAPDVVRHMIERHATDGRRPVILADGFCPDCGRTVPLAELIRCVRARNGYVVLDDTQALGIWGCLPDMQNPYGTGGGGSLRRHDIRSPAVILGSSLAKGFGAPVAALSGNARVVHRFITQSATRVHASPPSNAALHAAEHALSINEVSGDALRRHLAHLVQRFRRRMREAGLQGTPRLFPVQPVMLNPGSDPVRLHHELCAAGVRGVLLRQHGKAGPRLVFIFNAEHTFEDVDAAASAIITAVDRQLAAARYGIRYNDAQCESAVTQKH